jgi:hypothetical protein
VDPRAGLDDVEKILTLPGLELQSLGRPARSQSLYRLRYFSYLLKVVGQQEHADPLCTKMRLESNFRVCRYRFIGEIIFEREVEEKIGTRVSVLIFFFFGKS